MRDIESKMLAAVRERRVWSSGNTATRLERGNVVVSLHGNDIASIYPGHGSQWTLAGWNTSTTRSRINALAQGLGWPVRVYTRAGQAYAWRVGTDEVTAIGPRDWINASN